MAKKEYVLGTDDVELRRLHRQHELWIGEAETLWQEYFKRGQRLLDLGCGPGFTSHALAEFLGPKGQVHAVDASAKFLAYLQRHKTSKNQAVINITESYIEKLTLNDVKFDGAFCRWLMIFVPQPNFAIQAIRKHLKPKAKFILQEYVAYETMALCPDQPIMKLVVDQVFASWRDEGGDPNRGRILPKILTQEGFRILKIEPIARAARGKDPLWAWPDDFYKSYLPRLREKGYISMAQEKEFFGVWKAAAKDPGSFVMAPTLINIVAEKI